MRWLAAATIVAVLACGLIGCGDSDGSSDPGGGAGGSADGGAAGSGALGGAGHAGTGQAGAEDAGESGAGSAGAGTAGSETSGAGGATAGSGGATAGSGGVSAGSGGVSAGAGGATAGSGGAAPSVPAAPTAFFAQVLSTTSISIRWNDNASDETDYRVYWSSTGIKPATPNPTTALDGPANTKSITAQQLTPGILYSFWIEAYNALGSSSALTGTATAGAVPEFTGLKLGFDTSTQLSFSWNDSVGETGYRVYLSTSPIQPPTPVHELPANTVSYTFSSAEITPYIYYWVWISAYNAIGDGLPSMRFGIVGTPPAAPKLLSIDVSVPSFTITANWTDASTTATKFNVYWSPDDTMSGPSATVDAPTHTSTLNQVIGDRYYRLWVEAVNPVGKSYAVQAIATTKTSDLSWRELWLDNDTQDVHLAVDDTFHFISDGDPLTELNVYQSGMVWTYSMGTPTALGPSASVLWNTTALAIDTSKPHFFWLEAKKPQGTLLSQRTLAPGYEITGLVATPSKNSVSLSWDVSANAQSYRVYTSTVNDFGQAVLSSSTSATSATVTGLLPGTYYVFFVRSMGQAFGGGGFLGDWNNVEATTTGP